jgi:hypothetical protein
MPAVTALLCLGGCSTIPGLEEPRITLIPQVALLEIEGDTMMQSNSGGPIANNPEMELRQFGLGDRDSEFGGTVRMGDGFSGIDVSVLTFDHKTSRDGSLSQDWGDLLQGDVVKTEFDGLELRARYIAQLFEYETENNVVFRLGAGLALAHREFTLRAREASGVRRQQIDMKDNGVPYIAARGQVRYMGFGLEMDYAISPDITFGGDFDGVLQDLELMGTYTFEDQDLTVYAGYRRSYLEANGNEGPLVYEVDFIIDGYVLGIEFTF